MSSRRVFVAAPFTNALGGSGFHEASREGLNELLAVIRDFGAEPFSSHEREEYGQKLDCPPSLADVDRKEIRSCSHFVGFLGSVASIGVWIEIGLALGAGKPVLLLCRNATFPNSQFLDGLIETGAIRLEIWRSSRQMKATVEHFLETRES